MASKPEAVATKTITRIDPAYKGQPRFCMGELVRLRDGRYARFEQHATGRDGVAIVVIETWGEKLDAIITAVQGERPDITAQAIEDHIYADWPNADEHQEWLNRAPVAEIASCILTSDR